MNAGEREARLLLAKYAGRSTWVGFEHARREAWAEIEADLRHLVGTLAAEDADGGAS